MFNVYNVLVREDEEKEKYNSENLIRFDKNGVRVEPFKAWFDCSSSIVWKPQLPPPVLSKDTILPNVERAVTPNERNTCSLDHTIRSQSSRILEKTKKDIPSISPLLKKYLKKDTLNHGTKPSLIKIKWHSSFTKERRTLKKVSNFCKKDSNVIEKLKKRASCFVSSNCRGKWVILASSLKNGYNLEGLWSKLSNELHQSLFQNCNVTLQTDPDRILIYTNFLSSTEVLKALTSVREMVWKMSYDVFPYGQVLCWNGGEVIIM